MNYFVYIIYNVKYKKFYIGQTNNLKRRLKEHNSCEFQKYTSKYDGRWVLVYKESFFDRTKAIQRENFLKKQKNRNFYIKLCKSQFLVG